MADCPKHIEVLVLGLGNELLTDDGVGVHVVRRLQKESLPQDTEILEIGTAILHVQHLLEQAVHVVAIDAVRAGDKPGSVYCFDIDQAQLNQPVTLHDLGIVGVLKLIPESLRPKVTILGVEPETIDYGMELSPLVEASLPRVAQIARKIMMQILSRKAGCRADLLEIESLI